MFNTYFELKIDKRTTSSDHFLIHFEPMYKLINFKHKTYDTFRTNLHIYTLQIIICFKSINKQMHKLEQKNCNNKVL